MKRDAKNTEGEQRLSIQQKQFPSLKFVYMALKDLRAVSKG